MHISSNAGEGIAVANVAEVAMARLAFHYSEAG
jgi:hypothetical protein